MAKQRTTVPNFEPFEADARGRGLTLTAGVDEAGRGPLAGPVVAAAVILPLGEVIPDVHDSKQLTARQRDRAYGAIIQRAVSFGVGIVSHAYIDQHNILQATLEAMRRAVYELQPIPDFVLVDGNMTFPSAIPQQSLVKGDARCASIAAASIVAKVTRDRLMTAYAKRYPDYGFNAHKGYPTQAHYRQLQKHGPCPIHRLSFKGVKQAAPLSAP